MEEQEIRDERKIVLRTENLTKIYGNSKEAQTYALRNVSISVRKGDFLAIMGPSGAGKSTLLNLLGGLERPTKGKVFINGSNIYKLSNIGLAKLRNDKIGFVFQAYNLITRMSVIENVEAPLLITSMPTRKIRKRAIRSLKILGIKGNYEKKKPLELSGGEQQRVAVARALITNPEIILADEPTGNLDTKNADVLIDILLSLNRNGRTIVMVTHSPELSMRARRRIFIRDGVVEREELN